MHSRWRSFLSPHMGQSWKCTMFFRRFVRWLLRIFLRDGVTCQSHPTTPRSQLSTHRGHHTTECPFGCRTLDLGAASHSASESGFEAGTAAAPPLTASGPSARAGAAVRSCVCCRKYAIARSRAPRTIIAAMLLVLRSGMLASQLLARRKTLESRFYAFSADLQQKIHSAYWTWLHRTSWQRSSAMCALRCSGIGTARRRASGHF